MILRIGLDFDNTIANYDLAFSKVAELVGLNTQAKNKSELKKELQNIENGEILWQKVQGLTYGQYIHLAEIQSGLLEFVYRARSRGDEVFIVSHKTEYGHFDELFTPLRQAALGWLAETRVVGDLPAQIKPRDVYFCSTQDEKVKKINELGLDIFVDDLEEVFKNDLLSPTIRKILFSTSSEGEPSFECHQSWREISYATLGEISTEQASFVITNAWKNVEVESVQNFDGRGNSRIFKVSTKDTELALKIYPDLTTDARPRRANEWLALNLMNSLKMQTPKPFLTSKDLNWSLLEWIDGSPANSVNSLKLSQTRDFVRALSEVSSSIRGTGLVGLATESCLTPSNVEEQILGRFDFYKSVEDTELQKFFNQVLVPTFDQAVKQARYEIGSDYHRQLLPEFWVLSPSDFGLHNAIVTPTGDLVFYDFEYFGWDDPVKLTADFCLHPAMSLDTDSQKYWSQQMKLLFAHDSQFELRLNSLAPLYAVRWALIILNEFRSDKIKNRLHAQSTMQSDIRRKQIEQLEKAKLMIENLDRSIF